MPTEAKKQPAKKMPEKKSAKAPAKDVFVYANPFPKGEDTTKYRLVAGARGFVKKAKFGGKPVLVVDPKALTLLAHEAIRDVSFLLRPKHQQQVASILKDPEASPNDRFKIAVRCVGQRGQNWRMVELNGIEPSTS
jgi:hypothetical protein